MGYQDPGYADDDARPCLHDTLERFVPVFDADLNRNFPGDPRGLLPQRIAAAAMAALAGAALVIDIHASNIFLREIPQVRINQEFAARLVPMAQGMNLDLIWLHGAVTVLEATIAIASTAPARRVWSSRWASACASPRPTPSSSWWGSSTCGAPSGSSLPTWCWPRPPTPRSWPTIATCNHWRFGAWLQAGDLIGQVYDAFLGSRRAEIRAPVAGLLSGLRHQPLL